MKKVKCPECGEILENFLCPYCKVTKRLICFYEYQKHKMFCRKLHNQVNIFGE